jgi:hypothetical protein
MIKIAERQYAVKADESVTVTVQATGTAHLVSYDLDGEGGGSLGEGQSEVFKIPPKQRRVLTLLFTFSNDADGCYTVKLTGSQGGLDTDKIQQGSFGIPTTTADYHFRLQS